MKTSRILIICAVLTANRSLADEPKEKQQPPPPLPSRFAELVRETEKTAETMDQPATKVAILVELAGARRWAGDKVEARKTLELALAPVEKIEAESDRSDWHLTIAKELAALGAKAEASRLLVRALVAAKKIEEGPGEMIWWAPGFLEKIAREQVKLGERERAGETLELVAGWVDRAKKNELFGVGDGRLELFVTQVETNFFAEAERNFDRLWSEVDPNDRSFHRTALFGKLEELVRPDVRERNEASWNGSGSASAPTFPSRKARLSLPSIPRSSSKSSSRGKRI